MYIQKDLTLGYTAHALNLFNSHSFSNVGLIFIFKWSLLFPQKKKEKNVVIIDLAQILGFLGAQSKIYIYICVCVCVKFYILLRMFLKF